MVQIRMHMYMYIIYSTWIHINAYIRTCKYIYYVVISQMSLLFSHSQVFRATLEPAMCLCWLYSLCGLLWFQRWDGKLSSNVGGGETEVIPAPFSGMALVWGIQLVFSIRHPCYSLIFLLTLTALNVIVGSLRHTNFICFALHIKC